MEKLRYTDETDRCYGAAGMAISLVVYDGEEMLSAISLDGPAGSQTMTLAPESRPRPHGARYSRTTTWA